MVELAHIIKNPIESGSMLSEKIKGNKIKSFLIAVALIAVYLYISNPLVISVVGTGEVNAKPEEASVVYTVTSDQADPTLATQAAKARAEKLKQDSASFGINQDEIFTSQVSVVPLTDKQGFRGIVSVGITMTQIDRVNELVSELYTNGALYVSQPVLSVKDPNELERQSIDAAIKDANSQATKLGLKRLKLFKKQVSIIPSTNTPASSVTSQAGQVPSDTAVVTPEEIKVNKTVYVIYKMW